MKWLEFGCILFLAVSCDKQSEPEKPVIPLSDSIPVLVDLPEKVSCRTACENQRLLGCELGRDTPEGSSCEEVCENSMRIFEMAWDVQQLTDSKGCQLQ